MRIVAEEGNLLSGLLCTVNALHRGVPVTPEQLQASFKSGDLDEWRYHLRDFLKNSTPLEVLVFAKISGISRQQVRQMCIRCGREMSTDFDDLLSQLNRPVSILHQGRSVVCEMHE